MSGPASGKGWDSAYETRPPWDIGRPQPALAVLGEHGLLRGRVLDAGCGTGEHALLAASLGCEPVGIDLSSRAIQIATESAAERGLRARFVTGDALSLHALQEDFDVVIDAGLFHLLDDDDRHRYVASLRAVVCPGGACYLMCFRFSDQARETAVHVASTKESSATPSAMAGGSRTSKPPTSS
ncbi:MAG TPA: class I SAM-dependent methyltransferase [Acidimicrobiales bacterium]|nr:class I SAM-dependent methyltransferase [Acidimicrobiales bacterium]